MVLNLLGLTGAEAAGTVVVGDTEFDMGMARAAGARAIGVDWAITIPTGCAAAGPRRWSPISPPSTP